MRQASRVLYVLAAVFAGLEILVSFALSIFSFVVLVYQELLEAFLESIQYNGDTIFFYILIVYIGFVFATVANLSIVAIPIFINARKQLDVPHPSKGLFITSIIFGCFTNYFGITAGILSLVYRNSLSKNQEKVLN